MPKPEASRFHANVCPVVDSRTITGVLLRRWAASEGTTSHVSLDRLAAAATASVKAQLAGMRGGPRRIRPLMSRSQLVQRAEMDRVDFSGPGRHSGDHRQIWVQMVAKAGAA